MKTIVSEKGQMTIPKAVRDSLGLVPGTELDVREEGGALVARRLVRQDPLDALVGLLPQTDVDTALADLRGPAWSADLDEATHARRRR
jgi:AbrB family looped-hinge helix DNA binding protein